MSGNKGKTPADIARAAWSARSDLVGELRQIDEGAADRAYTEAETENITEIRSKLETLDNRVSANLEIAARGEAITDAASNMLGVMLDRESGKSVDTRSIGERFTEADGFNEYREHGYRGNFGVDLEGLDLRAVTTVTNGVASGGAFQNPTRVARVGADFLDRRTYLLDLLPHGTTSDNSVEYVQDVSPLADLANKATEIAEDSAKPQAGPTFEVKTDPVRTIAAWANITRQAAADNAQMMSYLDGRLRYSLKRRADGQVINGAGTGATLTGLLAKTGILTYAPGSAEARQISIRHGIRLMEDAETVPEIIVLNPADAELFDLTNAATAGLHAVPNLNDGISSSAWGLRQVHSTAIAAGTAMLIDPTSVMVWDRQDATAYLTDSHASNFVSNVLTLLLEARLALTLFDPKGVLALTFNGTV